MGENEYINIIRQNRFNNSLFLATKLGVIILGIIGKICYITIALLFHKPLNLSIVGILQLLVASAVIGFIGGIIRYFLLHSKKFSSDLRSIMIGLILWVISLLLLFFRQGIIPFSNIISLITIITTGCLYGYSESNIP